MNQPEYLPTTREAMNALGWDELDVLLISGDAYVDHHSFAMSLLGRWLVAHGFRTGIVAQPSWENTDDITRMGKPRLFVGVGAGALDSLVAHYTAFRKKRGEDAYSPGGKTGLRPNRAGIVYTGLVRQAFPGVPVVLGGIEASLRRASHYDFWSDAMRRSIVLDSKADAVLYGMGEKSILALAELLKNTPSRKRPADAIVEARLAGSAYATHPDKIPADAEELPSHEAILADPGLLIKATMAFERQMLQGGPCLVQRHGGRAVVFEPPPPPLTGEEMDAVYGLPFTRKAHPSYTEAIPAVAMIESSVVSHRGCGGGCSFCSLALHQGRTVQSRSAKSILDEVTAMASGPEWRGSISDVGGPSSNMWNARCEGDRENCQRTSCLHPKRCRYFKVDQEGQVDLLRRVAAAPGVKHVRVASGVRHDLALESDEYMKALVSEFTGGQLKIAPEHIVERVLRQMRKPSVKLWNAFLRAFDSLSKECGKEQYIVPYLMSAFPGCTDADMEEIATWLRLRGWRPQQVQCFIPTPGTLATAMYHAKQDPDGLPIHVAQTDGERLFQHRILVPDAEPGQGRGRKSDDRERRPARSGGGDRPRGERSKTPYGERSRDERPRRPFGERAADGERPRGDRPRPPFKDRGQDERPRRPFRERSGEGERSRDDRPRPPFKERSQDDRPRRPFRERTADGERPRGERPRPPFKERSQDDRPRRPFRERSGEGERSRDDRPRPPFKDRPQGDRPRRPFGERTGDDAAPRRPFNRGGQDRSASPGSKPFKPRRDGDGGGGGGGFKKGGFNKKPGGPRKSGGGPGKPGGFRGDRRGPGGGKAP